MEVPKIDDRDKNIQRVDTGESPIERDSGRHPGRYLGVEYSDR